MISVASKVTIYFDGSCALCRAEIEHYRRCDIGGTLSFVDVSDPEASVPSDLIRQNALKRFHVRNENGRLLSGAAAFVELWRHLPRWRILARRAALPGMMTALDFGYAVFLPIRPFISRLFGKMQAFRARADAAKLK